MRLPLLVSAGVLLMALLPCPPCRALLIRGPVPGARQAPQLPQPLDFFQPPRRRQVLPVQPVPLTTGEEYFFRQGNLNESPAAPLWSASSPLARRSSSHLSPHKVAANFSRALRQLRSLPWRPLDSPAGPIERGAERALSCRQEDPEKERRSRAFETSVDVPYIILRQLLEIERKKKYAEQAEKNRQLMESIGK
ncbi:corticoliberin-like [Myotis myotis]|uniref:Corticoliberin n=1 Tax=Myotis myotis TaxID=51298 RepID=A0A7J7THY3_MYOMY|nr:corticoliberin-like [Myotis myotis]KAF6300384.1 corticotropin releasing hormone [Myotis myotis]